VAIAKVLVLRAAGTNCDAETAYAFQKAGAETDFVHINRLAEGSVSLNDYQILAVPGGFTYGDDISAGKVLANELRHRIGEEIRAFVDNDRLVIGICNGFQVLVKMGILPGWGPKQEHVTLTNNDSNRYEDRWIYLRVTSTKSPFLRKNEIIYLPMAHGEGKFVVNEDSTLARLEQQGQVVVKYCDIDGNEGPYPVNPNGSIASVAGICDETGRVLGLMPHPERYVEKHQHPRWTRDGAPEVGDGLRFFRNAVGYFA
jgi:phosphoribosylformylglycinamidine synthase subunit PurQ / glutaminase